MINYSEHEHMRRYLKGRMSTDERLAFEAQMQSDAFLADAVEGFSADPSAIDDIPSYGRSGRPWFYSIAGLGLVALSFVAAEVLFVHDMEGDLVSDMLVETQAPALSKPLQATKAPLALRDNDFTIEPISEPELEIVEPIVTMLEEHKTFSSDVEPMKILDAPSLTTKPSGIVLHKSNVIFIEDLKIVKETLLEKEDDMPLYVHEDHVPALHEKPESPLSTLQEKYLSQFEKQSYRVELTLALKSFNKANYQESLNAFDALNAEYGSSVNHHFYAGLCAFHLENYEMATKELGEVRSLYDASFYEEATWYYALSLQALGKDLEARKLFKEIYEGDGHYAPMAASRLLRKS